MAMRLVVLSMVLPLVLGAAACAAPDVSGEARESAPAEEVDAVHALRPVDIQAKAAGVVDAITGLMKLNLKWNERLKSGSSTPAAQREIRETVTKMRAALATLPSHAAWVADHVEHDRDAIKAGVAEALASEKAKTHLGPEKIRELIDALNHAGGADQVILQSTAVVKDRSVEIGEELAHGKKMPLEFVCGLVGTIAGANAARADWCGVAAPLSAMLAAGCIH
jgi:hypothetical protein